METKFYYLRNDIGQPVISVCLAAKDGAIARGVAICSPSDNPVKKRGRAIALGRAIRAFERGTGGLITRDEPLTVIHKAGSYQYGFKSVREPGLNPLEIKLLNGL